MNIRYKDTRESLISNVFSLWSIYEVLNFLETIILFSAQTKDYLLLAF